MRGKAWLALGLALLLTVGAIGCALVDKAATGDGKLTITTTIGMITDIVEKVGGDKVQVTGLMKPGVDPHVYKASQGDVRKIEKADLVFYNGLYLEGKMAEILKKSKKAIAVTDGIDRSLLMEGDKDLGEEYDPHVWFDVTLWMKAVEKIRDELAAADPAHADLYKSNAAAYLIELKQLHEYAKTQIASIPQGQRVLVTAHDAFGYFGRAYGIEVRGLQGLSTAAEYGSRDVSELRDFLVSNKIKAVFVESSIPKRSIEAVVKGAKEKGHIVSIGGELFSDAMGKAGTPEGTYMGMVRHNVDTIVKALK